MKWGYTFWGWKYCKDFYYFATNMLLQLKGGLLCQNATILCCYLYLNWRHVSVFALGHLQVTRYIFFLSSTTLCKFWLAQIFLFMVFFPVPSVSNYLLPSSSNRLSRHHPILILAFLSVVTRYIYIYIYIYIYTHKIHVTIFHVGKHRRHFYNSSQLTITVTNFDTKSQRECAWPGCRLKDGHVQCTGNTSRDTGTVRGSARRPHFSIAIISVTVQLRI